MILKTPVVICLTVALVALLGLVTFLIVEGKDITGFLLAATSLASSLAILLGLNQVSKQTNGTLSKATADKETAQIKASNLEKQLLANGIQPADGTVTPTPINPSNPTSP